MLCRFGDQKWIMSNISALRDFSDLEDNNKWYYYAICEAVDGHDHSHTADDYELWTNTKDN